ncbi:MAG: hypothetical protein U1D06_07550 [Paracoccaceae bacterium]|nr:hypothetical protein [Paracoccaceae bacterium]
MARADEGQRCRCTLTKPSENRRPTSSRLSHVTGTYCPVAGFYSAVDTLADDDMGREDD